MPLAVLIAIVGATSAAVAMHLRESRKELARAPGGSALYEVQRSGPEGGGSLGYSVQGRTRADVVDFLLSSDFSPGNGSRPQTVSAKTCEERVGALAAELARRKFAGVAVHPEACRAKPRAGFVIITASQER